MNKYHRLRILNDVCDADLVLSTFEIHDIPKLVTETGLKHWTKRALVVSEDLDDYLFF